MNYKKGSRNGDYFARGAQESQAWAAEHITGGGDASSPRMHEEGKQQRKNPKPEPWCNVGMKPKVCKAPRNTARLENRDSVHYPTSGAGNWTLLFSVSITKQEQGMGLILPASSFLLCIFASV